MNLDELYYSLYVGIPRKLTLFLFDYYFKSVTKFVRRLGWDSNITPSPLFNVVRLKLTFYLKWFSALLTLKRALIANLRSYLQKNNLLQK